MVMSNSPSPTGFTQNLAQNLAQALLLEQVRFTKQQLLQPENKTYIRNFISQSYRHADQIFSVHDKFHRTLILSGFCLLKIAKISLNSSFFPKPIKR